MDRHPVLRYSASLRVHQRNTQRHFPVWKGRAGNCRALHISVLRTVWNGVNIGCLGPATPDRWKTTFI